MKSGPVAGMRCSFFRVSFLTQVNLCQNTDMSQDGGGVDLKTSLGYLLKEASSALRAAMEEVLRPLGMSVTHYSLPRAAGPATGLVELRARARRVRDTAD